MAHADNTLRWPSQEFQPATRRPSNRTGGGLSVPATFRVYLDAQQFSSDSAQTLALGRSGPEPAGLSLLGHLEPDTESQSGETDGEKLIGSSGNEVDSASTTSSESDNVESSGGDIPNAGVPVTLVADITNRLTELSLSNVDNCDSCTEKQSSTNVIEAVRACGILPYLIEQGREGI